MKWTKKEIKKMIKEYRNAKENKIYYNSVADLMEQQLKENQGLLEHFNSLTGVFAPAGVCEPGEGFKERPQDVKGCVEELVKQNTKLQESVEKLKALWEKTDWSDCYGKYLGDRNVTCQNCNYKEMCISHDGVKEVKERVLASAISKAFQMKASLQEIVEYFNGHNIEMNEDTYAIRNIAENALHQGNKNQQEKLKEVFKDIDQGVSLFELPEAEGKED